MPFDDELTRVAYAGQAFSIEFYVLRDGSVPAEAFLDSLSVRTQAKFDRGKKRLNAN